MSKDSTKKANDKKTDKKTEKKSNKKAKKDIKVKSISNEPIPMSLRFNITLLLKKENLSASNLSKTLKTDVVLVEQAINMLVEDGDIKKDGNKWELVKK